jgi:protein TonB
VADRVHEPGFGAIVPAPALRSSWFLLSLLVHGAAIGTAVGVGLHAGSRAPQRPPRVELLTAVASEPSAPPVEVPPVVAEPMQAEPEPRCDIDFVEPIDAPPAAPAGDLPVDERLPLSLVRIRSVVMNVTESVSPQQVAESEPPPPTPPAPISAFVDASPCADNPPPDYPPSERARGHEGTVLITVNVDARGDVVDVALRQGSPHPGLNRAALRAVRSWKFDPARRDGIAVEGRIDVPVVFRLTDR